MTEKSVVPPKKLLGKIFSKNKGDTEKDDKGKDGEDLKKNDEKVKTDNKIENKPEKENPASKEAVGKDSAGVSVAVGANEAVKAEHVTIEKEAEKNSQRIVDESAKEEKVEEQIVDVDTVDADVAASAANSALALSAVNSTSASAGSSGANNAAKTASETPDAAAAATAEKSQHKKSQDSENAEEDIGYKLSYSVGVAENKNSKYRQTMEDVHTYVANFVERLDWGYFAIFDGHAGKSSAKWCGQNLHLLLEKSLISNEEKQNPKLKVKIKHEAEGQSNNDKDVRDCLDYCFQEADELITHSSNNIGSSGCTAAVAIIRWELDEKFEDSVHSATWNNYKGNEYLPNEEKSPIETPKNKINRKSYINSNIKEMQELFDFIPSKNHKRMLYTANVGDSRLVLCRSSFAIRLSYDHKGSDTNESNRIIQSGGLIMKNRVNGVLAVTRSLGDSYLKNLIIGRPYTTAIEINEHDEFLILACDGLWDIMSDQEAVDLVRDELDPNKQAKMLVDYAMKNLSTDNITVMVIRFDKRIFRK